MMLLIMLLCFFHLEKEAVFDMAEYFDKGFEGEAYSTGIQGSS